MKQRYALISTHDKSDLKKICAILAKYQIKIISTGATAKFIQSLGFECKKISNLTKYKEILDGRVKTIHPLVYASLLFKRKDQKHIKYFDKLNFPLIDFVIVNLYPFKKSINSDLSDEEIIEMIDIGGIGILRSAAKNYKSVTSISDKKDYVKFINNIKKNNGKTSLIFRKTMASKVFKLSSSYDKLIANWIDVKSKQDNVSKIKLRYGENPHQKAFYKQNNKNSLIRNCIKLGKGISYNNILDIEAAFNCSKEFKKPTCVIVKHNNPCGVASSSKIINAFRLAYSGDPVSSFGGVVSVNRVINEKFAKLITNKFFEVIIAKNFTNKALLILNKLNKIILIKTKTIKLKEKFHKRSTVGGYLLQDKNNISFSKQYMKCLSKKKATKNEINDLVFGFKVCKHVSSNAIVLVKNNKTIGIGAGQMSRIDSVKIAISKINKSAKLNGYVVASDAFFPFTDGLKILKKNNCRAVIQPMGSINDKKIIDFADKNNLSLYFSKYRFFKH